MTNCTENSTKIRGLTSDGISFSKSKVKIKLILKNRTNRLVLTLTNVFYLSYNLLNLVSLDFLNNMRIYYHNKDQILYNFKIQKIFAFAKQYRTSFFLYLLNLSSIAMNLLKNNGDYEGKKVNVNQT